jgi:hypothetical protein
MNSVEKYMIDWLTICVKNKLIGHVKKSHGLMHQPNNMNPI